MTWTAVGGYRAQCNLIDYMISLLSALRVSDLCRCLVCAHHYSIISCLISCGVFCPQSLDFVPHLGPRPRLGNLVLHLIWSGLVCKGSQSNLNTITAQSWINTIITMPCVQPRVVYRIHVTRTTSLTFDYQLPSVMHVLVFVDHPLLSVYTA